MDDPIPFEWWFSAAISQSILGEGRSWTPNLADGSKKDDPDAEGAPDIQSFG